MYRYIYIYIYMEIRNLLLINSELMNNINNNLDDSEIEINDIYEKQKNITLLNNNNNYYLDRLSNLFFRIYSKFNVFSNNLNNQKMNNNVNPYNNLINELNDNNNKKSLDEFKKNNFLFLAKDIGKKIDKQNEKLYIINQLNKNNIIHNNNNIKKINKLI